MRKTEQLAYLAMLAFAVGCGGDREPGMLEVRIYGEEYIEEEIPAAEFNDGWRATFAKFLVSLGEVSAATDRDAEPALLDAHYRVFDLTQSSGGAGFAVTSAEVEGGLYDHLGYRIAPAAAPSAGNATEADTSFMVTEGFAVYVEGTAAKGTDEKTFAWGFSAATGHEDCESHAEVDSGEAAIEITIHGDHLFYDDLVAHEPSLAFDLLAEADADSDGQVTEAELAAFDITTQERYQVGSLDIDNLWDFVAYSATTLGHVDGEGHCHFVR